MLTVCAGIPCCNNIDTVARAVDSIYDQTFPINHVTVIDDASDDTSSRVAKAHGAEVVRLKNRSGRGAARAALLEKCKGDLLLSCDATNALQNDFLEKALPWFNDQSVAAVFGRLTDPEPQGVAGRWRARHLFKQSEVRDAFEYASLSTWAYVCRVELVRRVGGFQVKFRHSEDYDLGVRLLDSGLKVVFEPECQATPLKTNSITQCLERHWRWNVAHHGMTLAGLRNWGGVAWKSMVIRDLKAKDPVASLISLILPIHHYSKCWLSSENSF